MLKTAAKISHKKFPNAQPPPRVKNIAATLALRHSFSYLCGTWKHVFVHGKDLNVFRPRL